MDKPTEEDVDQAREVYERELQAEFHKWDQLGVLAAEVNPAGGMLPIAARLEVLRDVLVEKGIITMEELEIAFYKYFPKKLETIRLEITPGVQAQKLEAIKNGRLKRMH